MPEYYRPSQFEELHFAAVLAAPQERDLLRRWQESKEAAARESLVRHFALFTSKLAHRFAGPVGRHPDMIDDCIGVANMALLKAIDDFDLSRTSSRFTSLLYLLVRRYVIRFVRKEVAAKGIVDFPSAHNRIPPEAMTTPFEYPPDPVDRAEALQARLLEVLPELSDDEQVVVKALFFDRVRPTDTCQMFSPVKTLVDVLRLKSAALARLRERLA